MLKNRRRKKKDKKAEKLKNLFLEKIAFCREFENHLKTLIQSNIREYENRIEEINAKVNLLAQRELIEPEVQESETTELLKTIRLKIDLISQGDTDDDTITDPFEN